MRYDRDMETGQFPDITALQDTTDDAAINNMLSNASLTLTTALS